MHRRFWLLLVSAVLLLAVFISGVVAQAQPLPQNAQTTYLPLVQVPGQPSIFGVEVNLGQLSSTAVRPRAAELGVRWVRINGVLWHRVQPNNSTSFDWNVLNIQLLDRDLATARELGITPAVVIRGAPEWAALLPGSRCSAVREDRLAEYAIFLETIAARYRDRVTYWELGNEPDVDPNLVSSDSPFGCLGDANDPYYGGERYGRMLQVAAAALRRGNPQARIIFGGLLLDRPETTTPGRGNPERFLEGALRAGAANSFDILAFHSYPSFNRNRFDDQDFDANSPWLSRGGWTLGKVNFIREVMARYGVNKPLWLNEMGLIALCNASTGTCDAPTPEFEQAQAEHLVRAMSRAAAHQVEMVAWYPLNYTDWRSAGMLRQQGEAKPVFFAYKQLIRTVSPYHSVRSVDYGPGVEAYRFDRGTVVVDVLWSRTATSTEVRVPLHRNPQTSTLDGTGSVPGRTDGFDAIITVGFTPIYITRLP